MTDLSELKNLVGLNREELNAEIAAIGEKPFRANQLWHWIYHRGEMNFANMTTLSKDFRQKLSEHFNVKRPGVGKELTSKDNSRKWLLDFTDGNEAETVFIPEEDRGALCVSSQVGCTLTCSFCHTGTQRMVRNLTPGEIVGQVMLARDSYSEWPSGVENRKLKNIVMMGMGEPLLNYDNVAKALKVVMDNEGIAISKRRITLSTSGVVSKIHQCGEELGVNLAISLHAVNNELRDILVPINKKHPIKELLQACREYPGSSNARRITFEYVMLKGINDTTAEARELVRLMKGIPAKFNLIPFNPWPGSIYECSDRRTMAQFSNILNDNGFSAPIRMPRGRDIMAACGQLRTDSIRERKTAIAV